MQSNAENSDSWKYLEAGKSMWPNVLLAASVFLCFISASTTSAQDFRSTVTLEIYLPEAARLFIEGREVKPTGAMSRFVSPPLPAGKYTYTVKAIIPGSTG